MKPSIKSIFIISFFSLTGCQDILECIINIRPELPDKTFNVGNLNEFYSDDLRAGIKNEPRDDDYDYFFELNGELPEGLEMIIDYRTVIIEGLPTESGTFKFTLYLNVNPPEFYDFETGEYENSLCSDNTSKSYTIIIN